MRTRADSFEKEAELLRKSLGDLKEQLNEVKNFDAFTIMLLFPL